MEKFMLAIICCVSLTASPAMAECGISNPSNGVSNEAKKIIQNYYFKHIEAHEKIVLETSQELLGRMFDLETGKPKNLPPKLLQQYRLDARYFTSLLREEAAEAEARANSVFAKLNEPCPKPKP